MVEAAQRFQYAKRVEVQLYRKLRRIADNIRQIVEGFPEAGADPQATDTLEETLRRYAEVLTPWAQAEAERITAEIAARNADAWITMSNRMGWGIRSLLRDTPVGQIVHQRSQESAELITSLASGSAKAVREITLEGLSNGTRAEEISERIQRMGKVTKSRARLIARTEVARSASLLTQSRAEAIGCTHYTWRTTKDNVVRPSHKEMEGRVCEWAKPPTLSDGTTTHAGQIYNCRCYPEPIIPEYLRGRS